MRQFLATTALSPLLLTVSLAACGGPEFMSDGHELPIPDAPGLYALTGGDELARMDGNVEWEQKTWGMRSDFSPGIEFIIFDPELAAGSLSTAEAVRLRRVAWLRSELEPTGQAAPAAGSQWVAPNLESYAESLVFTPHPEIAGMLHVRPADRRLKPGLYELATASGQSRRARIGIQWSSVNKREYSAMNCVDRVLAYEARFQPCGDSIAPAQQVSNPAPLAAPAPPGQGLKITLTDPVRESGGLTVRGTVVNTSSMAQTVPVLRGTLLDASGNATESWLFTTPERSVAPGGETGFTTWVPARDGAARLNVDFAG